MQAQGAKYVQKAGTPTLEQLRAHARGELTLALPLVGVDGQTRALAIDVDEGGEAPIWALLDAAAARGLWAYGFALDAGAHNGGHIWCAFEEASDPRRLRHLASELIAAAGLPDDTERWPSGPRSDVRLPFGVHVRAGARGTLLLLGLDGERRRIPLDDAEGLITGLATVAAHEQNPLALLPEAPPEPERPARAATGALGAQGGGMRALALAASVDDLVQLLEEGAAAEYRRRSGPEGEEVLLHCACGGHTRGEQNGALVVKTGRNGIAQVHSYSTGCTFFTGPGKYHDYPDVHCFVRGALPALARRAEPERRHSDPAQAEARRLEAERKREQRRRTIAANRQGALDRAAQELTPRTARYLVLHALLDVAGKRDWCRPSVAQLMERTGLAERTVQYALRWLEGRYIVTETLGQGRDGRLWAGGREGQTPRRTFLREPLQAVATPQNAPGGVHDDLHGFAPVFIDHVISGSVLVGGGGGRGGATDEPDGAEWAVLVASTPAAPDELLDPAALAVWELVPRTDRVQSAYGAEAPREPWAHLAPALRERIAAAGSLRRAVSDAAVVAATTPQLQRELLVAPDYGEMSEGELVAMLTRCIELLGAQGEPMPAVIEAVPAPAAPVVVALRTMRETPERWAERMRRRERDGRAPGDYLKQMRRADAAAPPPDAVPVDGPLQRGLPDPRYAELAAILEGRDPESVPLAEVRAARPRVSEALVSAVRLADRLKAEATRQAKLNPRKCGRAWAAYHEAQRRVDELRGAASAPAPVSTARVEQGVRAAPPHPPSRIKQTDVFGYLAPTFETTALQALSGD